MDADLTKDKIAEVKLILEEKNKKQMEEQQMITLKLLEHQFNEEVTKYNQQQDHILFLFEKDIKKQEEAVKNRQIKEMDQLYKDFDESYSKKVRKYSKEVIELKLTEERMVKLQR